MYIKDSIDTINTKDIQEDEGGVKVTLDVQGNAVKDTKEDVGSAKTSKGSKYSKDTKSCPRQWWERY